MKRSILFLATLFFLMQILAQVSTDKPFSFQGVARDKDGKALANKEIDIRFKILDSGDAEKFSEEHHLTTDAYGVFVTEIGSVGASFKDINFSTDDYKLKVEILIGGNWETLNETDYLSVPYAKYADKADQANTAAYAQSAFFPAGIIVPFAGPTDKIPDGWLLCDGSAYDQSLDRYKALYNSIGYYWGKDGSNFRVPDLRGVFLRGTSHSRSDSYKDPDKDNRSRLSGASGSSNQVGSFQDDRFENHTHWLRSDHKDVVEFLNERGNLIDHSDDGGNINDLPRPMETRTADVYEESRHGAETRPMNAYVNYIIKL